jgi:8-oxo-dGTP diphosphatase
MSDEIPQITRIAAYGLVRNDEQILLCRLSKQLPRFAGMWTLPGGGLNFGEPPADGMVREVFEETGLHVEPSEIACIDSITGDLPDRAYHSIRILYHTQLLGGTLTYEQNGTTDLCRWFTREETRSLGLVDLVQVALPLAFT